LIPPAFRATALSRLGKWLLGVVAAIVALVLGAWLSLWFAFRGTPSDIVNFHPTGFEAKADAAFFFSVGDELKYSDEVDPHARTLARGHVDNFLVSPDRGKIAVVTNGNLLIVSADGSGIRQVATVDSIYKTPKPVGNPFFRDDGFQWSRDSEHLYLIRDQYYESKGSQLYSSRGELWRYDLESGKSQMVVKPFPAYTYFLSKGSGVYFSVPTDAGDLRLRHFDGGTVKDIGGVNAWEVPKQELASDESPFFSFSSRDFNELLVRGARFAMEQRDAQEMLFLGDKPYLAFTKGEGIKGPFYCPALYNSLFLPGGRYFLLNANCGNYEGQLLIDRETGRYEQLPKDTRVYLGLTTDDIPHYRISCGGIMAN
jgi:hypothetical protein